jgi:hypothetical protein
MRQSELEMIARLESTPLEEARRAISTGAFGDIGSPNHAICMSWLQAQDTKLQHARESEALGLSREALGNSKLATRIAIIALVLSVIAFAVQFVPWRG